MADLTYVAPAASDAAGQVGKPAEYPNSLYPELEPFSSEHFPVGDGHELYLEQSGKADGVPCIFVHGGPGGGTSPRSRRFFDPAVYRIVVFDQRGSGKSKPNAADDLDGSLVENNTGKLVADMEAIREHLKIEQWGMVFGGSWGSTLTLAYAQAHPTRTRSVVLRGVFTFTPQEVGYLFQDGLTAGQHPAAWAMYCKYIRDTSKSPECWEQLERHDLLSAYWSRLTHKEDPAVRNAAASAFVGYELSISKTFVDPAIIEAALATPSKLIPFAVMEVLYMRNAGFMPRGALLDGAPWRFH